MASTLSTVPAEQTTRQEWRGTNVTVAQVQSQLSRLRAQAAREEALDQDNPHPRNSVMDLVVIAADQSAAEKAAETIAALAAHHPCRAIIVLDEPGGERSIDATVTSYSHELMECVSVYEQVFLRARGAAAEHIPSLVEALLISDVTTYLWWTGSPPFREPRFTAALAIADVLILDTSLLERPHEGFLELAEMDRRNPGVSVGDIQWARLRPWREILAQFFNPTNRRGFLRGVGSVEIDYVARSPGNRSAAALLAGWLSASLGWSLKRATGAAAGTVLAQLESPGGHAVEIAMRPVERTGFASGDIMAVRLEAGRGGVTCSMTSHRDVEHRDQVITAGKLAGVEVPPRSLAMPSLDDTSLINQLLVSARGDDVFKRSLEAAAGLKAALR